MKNLIALTLVLFTGYTANARSMIPLVAEVREISETIETAKLYADGTVVAVKRNRGGVESAKLNPRAAQELLPYADALSSVKLVKIKKAATCKMMVMPFVAQELYVRAASGMRLILSAEGCAYLTEIKPKTEYGRDIAEELKSAIISTAEQAVELK